MPSEVIHSFHPKHTLTFCDRGLAHPTDIILCCKACGEFPGRLLYVCKDCDFVLDIKCAIAKLPLVSYDNHQHALAYFNFKTSIHFNCNICHGHSKNGQYFFRCVDCNFNIHMHCHPSLPKTIKHDCHLDPLTLTTSAIKDLPDEDENSEFYCNACEERRDLAESTYYCAACHFVAHVHCVFSEIIPHLQDKGDFEASGTDMVGHSHTGMVLITRTTATAEESENENSDYLHILNEEIAIHEKERDDLQKEIDDLKAKLDGLEKRHHQLRQTLQNKLLQRESFVKNLSLLGESQAPSGSHHLENDDRVNHNTYPDLMNMVRLMAEFLKQKKESESSEEENDEEDTQFPEVQEAAEEELERSKRNEIS
ncbi:hypothetical protein ACH5RR_028403 [Cinchona calisaya]|uniref:Phorbol-ester/DAG-type domain-containing protein n=1 Tax=Cinchona calisaya TaxID=153742 RepID=A0ABD2YS20_9GENT